MRIQKKGAKKLQISVVDADVSNQAGESPNVFNVDGTNSVTDDKHAEAIQKYDDSKKS